MKITIEAFDKQDTTTPVNSIDFQGPPSEVQQPHQLGHFLSLAAEDTTVRLSAKNMLRNRQGHDFDYSVRFTPEESDSV